MAKDKMTEIQEKLDSLKAMGNALFENRPVNKKILGQNILLHVRNIEILLSGKEKGEKNILCKERRISVENKNDRK